VQEQLIDYDQAFDQALAAGKVLLGVRPVRQEGRLLMQFPAGEYLDSLPGKLLQVGLTNLHRDPDNVVRRMTTAYESEWEDGLGQSPSGPMGYEQPAVWWTLAALAVRTGRAEIQPPTIAGGANPGGMPIAFCGPPGAIPRLSLADVIRADGLSNSERSLIRNRVVFIGAEYSGAGDRHTTPYSRQFFGFGERDMSGVEIHANIAETLLHPERIGEVPLLLTGLVWLPFLCAAALACDRSTPWTGGAIKFGLVVCAWGMGFLYFESGRLFPVAGLALGIVIVFIGVSALRMTRTERDKSRIRRLFGKYVSEEALARILEHGGDPRLGGDVANVTVLFSDIRDFTSLSEKLTPAEIVELLNAYFEQACEAVQKHGGMIDKFIGDAIMGLFGTPLASPDHARQAIMAALDLKDAANSFQEWVRNRFPALGGFSFRVGIGLHSGDVVVGNVGSHRRMEFTAIGDTVNTASRLEGLTKQMECVVVASRDTVLAAGSGVLTGKEATLPVKGKAALVNVIEIKGILNKEEVVS